MGQLKLGYPGQFFQKRSIVDTQIWTCFVLSKTPPEFLDLEVSTIGSIGTIFGDFDSLHVNLLNGT